MNFTLFEWYFTLCQFLTFRECHITFPIMHHASQSIMAALASVAGSQTNKHPWHHIYFHIIWGANTLVKIETQSPSHFISPFSTRLPDKLIVYFYPLLPPFTWSQYRYNASKHNTFRSEKMELSSGWFSCLILWGFEHAELPVEVALIWLGFGCVTKKKKK